MSDIESLQFYGTLFILACLFGFIYFAFLKASK